MLRPAASVAVVPLRFSREVLRSQVVLCNHGARSRQRATAKCGQTGSRMALMEKNKALDAAMAQIERAFGKGSIMRMGARSGDEQIEVISSGSLGLDIALGIGGLP